MRSDSFDVLVSVSESGSPPTQIATGVWQAQDRAKEREAELPKEVVAHLLEVTLGAADSARTQFNVGEKTFYVALKRRK